MASGDEDERLARLRAEAEAEMRRRLPTDGVGRAAKRRKTGGEEAERQAGGRFDYGAIQELATGITGFLLTCQLQRENSARKEAGPLLGRYLERCRGGGEPAAAGSSEPAAPDTGSEAAEAAPEAAVQEGTATEGAAPEEGGAPRPAALSAVKVPVRGLVALKLAAHPVAGAAGGSSAADASSSCPASSSFDAASAILVHEMAAALLADIAAGKQARLQHVQRIVPVQTTCRLEAAALQAAGGQLAALVAAALTGNMGSQQGADQPESTAAAAAAAANGEGASKQPLTFGIGLKQREISGKPAAAAPAAGDGSGAGATGAAPAAAAPLDRGGIITALAGGFETTLRQQHGLAAAVDLKAPDWVLICEVVPAGGELYAALCALPRALCTLKPKLHVQAVGRAGA